MYKRVGLSLLLAICQLLNARKRRLPLLTYTTYMYVSLRAYHNDLYVVCYEECLLMFQL